MDSVYVLINETLTGRFLKSIVFRLHAGVAKRYAPILRHCFLSYALINVLVLKWTGYRPKLFVVYEV